MIVKVKHIVRHPVQLHAVRELGDGVGGDGTGLLILAGGEKGTDVQDASFLVPLACSGGGLGVMDGGVVIAGEISLASVVDGGTG